jgi:hypothetical protein
MVNCSSDINKFCICYSKIKTGRDPQEVSVGLWMKRHVRFGRKRGIEWIGG